jgi:hypothetical protein
VVHSSRALRRAACCNAQDEEQAKWEAEKAAQAAKLRRDKLTLEKQSRALLKLPTKAERSEVRRQLAPPLPSPSKAV